jgi:hypothetical protein
MINVNTNNKMLLLYLITAILSCKMLYNYNLFLSLITIDGLMNACSWMLSFFNKDIKYTSVTENAQIYNNSILDRYISYLIFYIGYVVSTTFFWTTDIPLLYYLISLVPIPGIINNFVRSEIYEKINNIKQSMIKKIISKNIALGVNSASQIYLNKKVNIKYKEILPLLSDYEKSVNIAKSITKNLLLVLLMSYVRKYTSKFYYDIGKMIVSYKFGDKIESFNVNGARSKLVTIIDKKQWNKLLKPDFIKSLLNIYEEHENNSDAIKQIIRNYSITFSGMSVIWTLCSIFKYSCIAPIISIIMVLYRREYGIEMYKKLSILGLILSISMWVNNHLLISFLSQFGYLIIFNKVSFIICKNILKNIYKLTNRIIQKNKLYNKMLLTTIPYGIILQNVFNINTLPKLLIPNITYNLITYDNNKFKIIYMVIMATTMFSKSSLHIIYNGILIYILTSFIDRNIFVDLCVIIKKFINYLLGIFKKEINVNNIVPIGSEVDNEKDNTLEIIENINIISGENINCDIDFNIFDLSHEKFMQAIAVKEEIEDNNLYIIEDHDDDSGDVYEITERLEN